MSKPKKINFELIEPDAGGKTTEAYLLLEEIRERWHDELDQARIALAWRKETNPDVDGHLVLGRCVKLSDLQREMLKLDFVIVLNKQVWDDERFTVEKKRALIDHELCHAAVSEDDDGARVYEDGKPVFRVRKHDIEEFRCIIERHGCYKYDLEKFAESILKKYKPSTPGLFAPEREGVSPAVAEAIGGLVSVVDGKNITSMSMGIAGDHDSKVTITAADAEAIRANLN